ncbi:MAG: metal ABC transporter permease, partial [Mycobacteriaceae bacterium]
MSTLLTEPFMQHALIAGVPIAALAGVVGYFMVLRSQIFAGDALSHVAFTGALVALAFGVDARIGLMAATVGIGVVLGLLGDRGRTDDVVIGTVFAWVLGIGVLALSVYTAGEQSSRNRSAGINVLFGSIFGLSSSAAWTAAFVACGLLILVLLIARPLLFASIDAAAAAVRGVPVRVLGVGFLALAGATAGEATQAVGALLLLGLLAAPAGAAMRLTDRPFVALALAPALAVTSMVLGLLGSYAFPTLPPSFTILAVATAIFALSFL